MPHLRPPRWLWFLGLFALVAAVAGAGWIYNHSPSSPDATSPEPEAAAPGVGCFGFVDVEHGVTPLYPVQPGRVERVLVAEGDGVAAGAVLLRLDDRAARSRVEEARAGVA